MDMNITASTPERHAVFDDCIYTQGPAVGRDVSCAICLDPMEHHEETLTHCECQNAFHVACFDSLVASENPANPTGANPVELYSIKCPLCRGEMKPWPKAGCALPPRATSQDSALFREALQAAVTVFFGTIYATRDEEVHAEEEAYNACQELRSNLESIIEDEDLIPELAANVNDFAQVVALMNTMEEESRRRVAGV